MANNNDWVDLPLATDSGVDDWEDVGAATEPGFFDEGGQFQAGARGAAQGITFGFSDEIIAGFKSAFGDRTYEEELEDYRRELAKSKEAHPGTYLAGDIAGSLLLPIPGAGLKAATTAGKVGLSALKGAVTGGLEAAGRTEEDLLSVEGLKDVALGAGLGGAVGGAITGGGIAAKKGYQKLKGVADDVLDPTKLREGAIHKTPTQKKKELLYPKEKIKNTKAVKAGEKYGVFKEAFDETLPATQRTLKSIGEDLGATSRELTQELGARSELTKGPLKLKARSTLEGLLESTSEKVKKGSYDSADGRRATRIFREEFKRLEGLIDDSDNSLSAIRELKSNIYKRMDSSDFQFGGPKAGTQKDALKQVVKSLRKLEDESLKVNEKLLSKVSPGASRARDLLGKHRELLQDFSSLKLLEDQLAATVNRDVGKLGLKEIAAGSVGGYIDPIFGVVSAVSQATRKKLSTSKGQFWLAKAVEYLKNGDSPKKIEAVAKQVGVSVDELMGYISKENLMAAGAAGIDQ